MKINDILSDTNWQAYWKRLQRTLLDPSVDEAAIAASLAEARARMPVPVIWLIGKTQAGKTSIIRALTGSDSAEIGNGYQPCTRSARFYDHPTDIPVVRFLDTRGLGERAYDPTEDIQFCESQAHLLLAVMKVADPGQEAVFEVLHAIRKRHPEWPVLIAQTGLHELYPPSAQHPEPYPFDDGVIGAGIHTDLARALLDQRDRLGKLPGDAPVRWVPIDLTLPDDGFVPVHYGLDALWAQMEAVSSLDLRRQLIGDEAVRDVFERTAHQHIVGYTLAAAGLGAVPVIDLVAVSAVQAKLLHTLAALYGQRWDRRLITEFIGLLGVGVATGFVSQMIGKTVAKLIPGWGQTIGLVWGASASGATTYALGKAAAWFFDRRRAGLAIDAAALRAVYAEALAAGRDLVAKRARGKSA